MIFQVRTDNHIHNTEQFGESIRATVESALSSRYHDRLRRVEVYVQDTNAQKGGQDIRCSIEVHLAGRPAVAVDARAHDVDTAVDGAVEKVLKILEHQLERVEDRAGHTSAAGEQGL